MSSPDRSADEILLQAGGEDGVVAAAAADEDAQQEQQPSSEDPAAGAEEAPKRRGGLRSKSAAPRVARTRGVMFAGGDEEDTVDPEEEKTKAVRKKLLLTMREKQFLRPENQAALRASVKTYSIVIAVAAVFGLAWGFTMLLTTVEVWTSPTALLIGSMMLILVSAAALLFLALLRSPISLRVLKLMWLAVLLMFLTLDLVALFSLADDRDVQTGIEERCETFALGPDCASSGVLITALVMIFHMLVFAACILVAHHLERRLITYDSIQAILPKLEANGVTVEQVL